MSLKYVIQESEEIHRRCDFFFDYEIKMLAH